MSPRAHTALKSDPPPASVANPPKIARGTGRRAVSEGEAEVALAASQSEARVESHFVRLEALMDAAEADLTAPSLASLNPRSFAARIARRVRAYLAFAWSEPALYRRMFRQSGKNRVERCTPRNIVERTAVLIREAAQNRELSRPVIGRIDSHDLAVMQWVNLHGFADLVLNGILAERLRTLEDRLVVHLLGAAGFVVAANPAALEACARSASFTKSASSR